MGTDLSTTAHEGIPLRWYELRSRLLMYKMHNKIIAAALAGDSAYNETHTYHGRSGEQGERMRKVVEHLRHRGVNVTLTEQSTTEDGITVLHQTFHATWRKVVL